jgi:hypothetical protein
MAHLALELPLSVEEALRLEGALAAYDLVVAGIPPDPTDLAAAPILSDWSRILVPSAEAALVGRVSGHPRLPDSRIVTSRLLALDATAGWARTLSRLYRLTRPA